MNKPLLALLLGAFALGSAEFGTVGLIPSLGHQLQRSSDELGWLVAVYAIGVTVGAPLLTRLLQRFDTRATLAVSMAAAGALTALITASDHFGLLLAARALLGANHGLFFSLAMPLAGRLSPRSTIEGMLVHRRCGNRCGGRSDSTGKAGARCDEAPVGATRVATATPR